MTKLKKWLYQWYNISVFLSVFCGLVLGFGTWDMRQEMIIMAMMGLYLHFFEEFGYPGGFPWIGMAVEMGIRDTDATKWGFNQLSAVVDNWWFTMLVFPLALLLPNVKFMTLAVALFCMIEGFAHILLFNVSLKTFYNPGLASTVCVLLPIAIRYFIQINGQGLYGWLDYVLALVWIVLNYWFVCRSPFFKWMGKKSDKFTFTKEEVMRAERYMKQ